MTNVRTRSRFQVGGWTVDTVSGIGAKVIVLEPLRTLKDGRDARGRQDDALRELGAALGVLVIMRGGGMPSSTSFSK